MVEAAHRAYALGLGLGRGRGHLPGLGYRIGQWFLTEHVLAGGDRGEGDLRVRVARRADVDQVDVLPVDDVVPVGRVLGPAELAGGGRDLAAVAAAHHRHLCRQRQIERTVDGAPCL
jgi:hypothetical protein